MTASVEQQWLILGPGGSGCAWLGWAGHGGASVESQTDATSALLLAREEEKLASWQRRSKASVRCLCVLFHAPLQRSRKCKSAVKRGTLKAVGLGDGVFAYTQVDPCHATH